MEAATTPENPKPSPRRELKRKALLKAAVAAFNRQGYHQTSLEEIGEQLGMTKAALYYYFPSKAALLATCFDVNCIALTITSGTEAFDAIFARDDWTRRLFDKAVRRFPSGRPANAEEVARVAVFFASGQSAQVTGQTLSINGGLSFGGW